MKLLEDKEQGKARPREVFDCYFKHLRHFKAHLFSIIAGKAGLIKVSENPHHSIAFKKEAKKTVGLYEALIDKLNLELSEGELGFHKIMEGAVSKAKYFAEELIKIKNSQSSKTEEDIIEEDKNFFKGKIQEIYLHMAHTLSKVSNYVEILDFCICKLTQNVGEGNSVRTYLRDMDIEVAKLNPLYKEVYKKYRLELDKQIEKGQL